MCYVPYLAQTVRRHINWFTNKNDIIGVGISLYTHEVPTAIVCRRRRAKLVVTQELVKEPHDKPLPTLASELREIPVLRVDPAWTHYASITVEALAYNFCPLQSLWC